MAAIGLATGLGFAFILLTWIVRHPHRVIASVCVLSCASLFLPLGIRADFGSIRIEAGDILALGLLIESARRGLRKSFLRAPRWWRWSLNILMGLYLLNAARGFAEGATFQAIANAQRVTTIVLSLLVYFTYVAPGRVKPDRCTKLFFITGGIYTLVVALRLAGVLPTIGDVSYFNEEVARPIGAPPTMMLSCIAVLFWFAGRDQEKSRTQTVIVAVFAALVAVLQHRSVWIAVIAMVLFAAVYVKEHRKSAVRIIAVATSILVLVLSIAPESPISRALLSSSERAINQEDTVEARYKLWALVLEPGFMGDDINYVTGRPTGTTIVIRSEGRAMNVQAHSHYVNTIVFSGIVGVGANIVMMLGLLFVCLRSRAYLAPWSVIVVGELAYWVAYGQPYELSMLIGIGYALWRQSDLPTHSPGSVATFKEPRSTLLTAKV